MRVVGDDAEARVGRVPFHDSAQSHLCSRGHGIGFVENDKFEGSERGAAGTGLWSHGEDLFRA